MKSLDGDLAGFTMIELMVGIAIVGILAMIAIPQYSRYEARSRKTEAKTSLISAYTSLRAFATDNSSYTACIAAAGYKPEKGSRFYAVGFTAIPATGCGTSLLDNCNTTAWRDNGTIMVPSGDCGVGGSGFSYFPANASVSGQATPMNLPGVGDCATTVTKSTFKMQAVSRLGYPFADVWSIDEGRGLENFQDALLENANPCNEPAI